MRLRYIATEGVRYLAAEDVVELLHRRADVAGQDAALRAAADQLYDLAVEPGRPAKEVE